MTMTTRRGTAVLAAAALAATLSACSGTQAGPEPELTSSATTSTERPTTEAPSTQAVTSLTLPPLERPLNAPDSPTFEVFGEDYALEAYETAVALIYTLNTRPEWNDRDQAPPPESFAWVERYLTSSALTEWQQRTPGLAAGDDEAVARYISTFNIPPRGDDGHVWSEEYDDRSPTYIEPYTFGVEIGDATTYVYEDPQDDGEALGLVFDYVSDEVYANGLGDRAVVPTTRTVDVVMRRAAGEDAGEVPFQVVSWGATAERGEPVPLEEWKAQ